MARDLETEADLPAALRRTTILIDQKIAKIGARDFPRLIHVTASVVDDEIVDVDFIIELASEITMFASFSAGEEQSLAGREELVAERIYHHALEAFRVARDLKPGLIAIERCAKALVTEAWARRLPVRLISVHVAEFGWWTEPDDAQFLINIETSAPYLQPCRVPLLADNEAALRRMFLREMNALERTLLRRARLAANDA